MTSNATNTIHRPQRLLNVYLTVKPGELPKVITVFGLPPADVRRVQLIAAVPAGVSL